MSQTKLQGLKSAPSQSMGTFTAFILYMVINNDRVTTRKKTSLAKWTHPGYHKTVGIGNLHNFWSPAWYNCFGALAIVFFQLFLF